MSGKELSKDFAYIISLNSYSNSARAREVEWLAKHQKLRIELGFCLGKAWCPNQTLLFVSQASFYFRTLKSKVDVLTTSALVSIEMTSVRCMCGNTLKTLGWTKWNCRYLSIFYLQKQWFYFCSHTHKSCTRWGVPLQSLASVQNDDSFLFPAFAVTAVLFPPYSHFFSCLGPGLFSHPLALFLFSSRRKTNTGGLFIEGCPPFPPLSPGDPTAG